MGRIGCSLHTHSTFCDGANTLSELADYAADNNCSCLGFSGHAPTTVDGDYGFIPPESIRSYAEEVNALKEQYKGRLEIALGIEMDYFSPSLDVELDYVIGSVHYIKKNGSFIPMDISYELLKKGIDETFGGDAYEMAKTYYETLADTPRVTGCHIIGHADILTKYNEKYGYIDENDRRYRKYALEAIDALIERDVIIEVNTGAMQKGYKSNPYPADFIIKHINEKGGRLMLSSDCHAKKNLFYFFDETEQRLSSLGVKELYIMKNGKFVPVSI